MMKYCLSHYGAITVLVIKYQLFSPAGHFMKYIFWGLFMFGFRKNPCTSSIYMGPEQSLRPCNQKTNFYNLDTSYKNSCCHYAD